MTSVWTKARAAMVIICAMSHAFVFPSLSLSPAVHYLATFYCDRLKDNPLVVPHVLQGLVALVSWSFVSLMVSIGKYVLQSVRSGGALLVGKPSSSFGRRCSGCCESRVQGSSQPGEFL